MKKKNSLNRFQNRIEMLLGDEAIRLMEAMQQYAPKSIRYNRRLCNPEELVGPQVPWNLPYGRYWTENSLPSTTLEYAAGKYYIQEASAMLAVSAASQVIDFSDKIILDLAAAPGGKATQAAELISSGYLVANEVIPKRVNALTWNINRHRLNNVIVTSLTTNLLAQSLPQFFDIVIVDAPCSGEGLFQKRKHSLENWSEKNVKLCARRQTSILSDAITLTRPGGYIIYSTCTFAQEENEDQVEYLLNHGLQSVKIPTDLPVSPAITKNEQVAACSRRIFPHRENGAGAFVAIVKMPEKTEKLTLPQFHYCKDGIPVLKNNTTPFLQLTDLRGYFFENRGITTYFSYERIPEFLWENAIQLGAPIYDKRRSDGFMFGAVQIPDPSAIYQVNPMQAQSYLKGDDLELELDDGFYFIAHQGMILGPAKINNRKAINKLPTPLRRP